MPFKRKSKDDYLIAIISALSFERASVWAMLDEEHDSPVDFVETSEDRNSYTWGEIGSRNVVLASLPAGTYGLHSATKTASYIRTTYPSIKYGLLVGVAAGIPLEGLDIRLGDVVVSQPARSNGGVFQYDFGKALLDDDWERLDWLARPPEVLLRALAHLQSKHEFRGTARLQRHLQKARERHVHWAATFPAPDGRTDRLFRASYPHQISDENCSSCDPSELIERQKRDSPDFRVHYGIIGSGNALIKNSVYRDKIARMVKGCICLDMEAAGLMNDLPCLVIRGISDYADSHKNDDWQRFASATAAAFAKELLTFTSDVELEETHTPSRVGPPSNNDTTGQDDIADDLVIDSSAGIVPNSGNHRRPNDTTNTGDSNPQDTTVDDTAALLSNSASESGILVGNTNLTGIMTPMEGSRDENHPRAVSDENAPDNDDLPSLPVTSDGQGLCAATALNEIVHGHILDAELNVNSANLQTPTNMTALFGRIRSKLGQSIDFNKHFGEEGMTLLHTASEKGEYDMVECLLRLGVNVDAKTVRNATSLMFASKIDDVQIAILLLNRGANVVSKNSSGITALHTAARYDSANIAQLLLDHKADIEDRTDSKLTPLHLAAKYSSLNVARILLEHLAVVTARTDDAWTALHLAAARSSVEMVELLLANGADLEAKTSKALTALHVATECSTIEMVRFLLGRKPNIDSKRNDGWTSLHLAARYRSTEVVAMLLSHGANVQCKTNSGFTVKDVAYSNKDRDVLAFLEEHSPKKDVAEDDHGEEGESINANEPDSSQARTQLKRKFPEPT